jgi:hypothetical protein
MSGTDDLLDEREETHGDYENTARIIQRFKRVMYSELMERELRGQDDLSDVARETMEMMLHKFGRIISGKWDHPDHWEDLCGYPALVVRSIANAEEWVEYKSDNLREPDIEPDGYDWEADAIGSYHEAIQAIGEDVKAGKRELPAMFRQGNDPGDETGF